ncbi:MAG: HAD family phosphatase [Erysipelotrichales bacterium]|nr:HAD family phosphatase [Erysipelotrichales bacterium]
MIKAVIFDMDGLMIDSERVTYNGYKKVLGDMGLDITEEFYTTLLGRTIETAKQLFENVYGKDFHLDDVIPLVHKYMADLFDNEGVPVKKGLVDLLKYLKDNNYKTVVATSSQRKRVDHILNIANISQYFDDSICGDEVTHGKPNPEVFLRACEKAGVSPEEALVLEDSEAGIQAAYSGKIKVICIPDMKYPEEAYASKTTKILPSLEEVIDYLKEN